MIAPYITDKTKAIVITSPNNPAGYIISESEMKALGDYLKEKIFGLLVTKFMST